MRPRVTFMPACSRAELSTPARAQAARDPGGLRGLPGGEARGLNGGERGGKQVNAGAALRGVQAEAGLGVGVVGDLGAPVRVDRGVGFAGGDDLNAARREQGTQPDAEGQGEGFFDWPLARRPPESSPPWAASSTTTKRAGGAGGACAAAGRTTIKDASALISNARCRRGMRRGLNRLRKKIWIYRKILDQCLQGLKPGLILRRLRHG